MNRIQKLRLKALMAQDKLTDVEKTELESLKALAKTANFDPEKDKIEDETDDNAMTADDVKAVVIGSLKSIGLDEETMKSLKESLDKSGDTLTLEQVQKAVKENIGGEGLDQDALLAQVKAYVSENKGVSKDDLDKALKSFAKDFRTESRKEFDASNAQTPIEHRDGNLTVAQKQLLNICMMHVSEESIKSSDRPKSMNDGITEAQIKQAVANGQIACKNARAQSIYGGKAITAGGVGSGAELVNTDLSSDLLTRLYMESALASEMISQEIQMPSNPFALPMTTTRPAFFTGSEGGTPTNSDPATSQPTLTAQKLIGQSSYSYEADEDAIIAVLPMLQEALGAGAADALEGAIVNGDTTATHQDSDIHAVAKHHAKLFKGLRKYANAGSLTVDLSTGGISKDNIMAMKKQLGKYGMRPQDLILIAGVNGYNDLVSLDETLTLDKVGAQARILTGLAPQLMGIRIVPSSQVREDLNASGVYDGSVTTKGSILLVHKPSWLMGVRRGFTVEVDVDKRDQMNY